MSAQSQPPPLSFEELLAMEEKSPVRHEYIGGRLHAMEDGTPTRVDLITNLSCAVGIRLRGKPCRGSGGNQRLRTSETAANWYYPDFLIKCPPYRFHPRDSNSLLNPHAIFEVLSPATAEFDRTRKFDEYASIRELTDYVLVSADHIRVDHFRRLDNGGWELHSATRLEQELHMDNFGISVPLAEIYEDIEIAEAIRPHPDE